MTRTTTETFVIDAYDIQEAVEKAEEVMAQGIIGTVEEEKIEDGLAYEEIKEEKEEDPKQN